MKAKVSVVIPIYNVEKYIARCLDSVLAQSLNDLEIILVDDGTPDGSMQIVGRYAATDHRFRIVTHERNRGLMQARKTGYMIAESDYVLFCDSDDYLPPTAIETLYNEAKRSDADIVSGDMTLVFPDGRQIVRMARRKSRSIDRCCLMSTITTFVEKSSGGRFFKTTTIPPSSTSPMEKTATCFIRWWKMWERWYT